MKSLGAYFEKDSGYSGENRPSFEGISFALYDFYKKTRDLRKYMGKDSIWEGVFAKKQ